MQKRASWVTREFSKVGLQMLVEARGVQAVETLAEKRGEGIEIRSLALVEVHLVVVPGLCWEQGF